MDRNNEHKNIPQFKMQQKQTNTCPSWERNHWLQNNWIFKKSFKFWWNKKIVEKLEIKPIDLVRKNEQIWKDNYKGKEMTDVEIIKAIERNPKLIERPIVINEKHGIIWRPPEKVLSLFA